MIDKNLEIDIMLVEDSMSDAELTIRALNKGKIADKLVHVRDGEEALHFLFGTGPYEGRNTEQKPKVILLDLKMPKVNGIEVLEKLKDNDLTRRIPVVVLTSSKEHPDIKRCYDLGASSYIVKPVGYDNFTTAIIEAGCYWLLLNQRSDG